MVNLFPTVDRLQERFEFLSGKQVTSNENWTRIGDSTRTIHDNGLKSIGRKAFVTLALVVSVFMLHLINR